MRGRACPVRSTRSAALAAAACAVAQACAVAHAASCSVTPPAFLDFGAYNTITAVAPAGWAYQVNCTRTATGTRTESLMLTASFSTGSGTYASRTLTSGAWTVSYNLFADAARTQVIGDGSGSTVQAGPVLVTLTRAAPTYSANWLVYGFLPGSQNVAPGVYRTTQPIVLTLQY